MPVHHTTGPYPPGESPAGGRRRKAGQDPCIAGGPADATVGLVQSDIDHAARLEYPEICRIVREAVQAAGGLTGIVTDGDTVVLKPNIVATRGNAGLWVLSADPYRPALQLPREVNGVTTDYRVTRAVVELVREINPTGKVLVMEGSAWGSTAKNLRLMGYDHETIPGVDSFIALDEEGAGGTAADDLVAVDLGGRQRYPADLKPVGSGGIYYLPRTYYEADVLISIPVLKNHLMTGMTGGVKNVAIGATPPSLYGRSQDSFLGPKRVNHAWVPLNAWIHDYYLCRPVDFVVTDGLQGLSCGPRGAGCRSVDSARMNMRLVLAGADAVAVDTVHSCIIGVDPAKVDHLRHLAEAGAGLMDTGRIDVRGNRRVDQVKKPFRLSRALGLLYRGRRTGIVESLAPDITRVEAAVEEGALRLTVGASPDIVKLEVYVDGCLCGRFSHGTAKLEIPMEGMAKGGTHRVDLLAYDRFFHCTQRSRTLRSN